MRRWLPIIAAGAAIALGGCGSSSSRSGSSSSDPATPFTAKDAGANPSKSAKMVCAPEAQKDISRVLGVRPVRVTTPTWTDQVYSCKFAYSEGAISLSVKELTDSSATTGYFDDLATRLGRRPETLGLGQDAFLANDGSVVVRKDLKVLDVDVSALPAAFGQPPQDRSDVAVNVASTVMGCWTGA